ncbi:MAG TPA: universal stress protein [Thermoleophilaceae bacterium]|jgi:nucleotide-binding universal stress UspA family protein
MTVIAGFDGNPQGRDALVLAASLARALGERLLVATIYDVREAIPDRHVPAVRDLAEATAREGVGELGDEIEAEPIAAPGRSTPHGLHELAESEGATAVVVGSTHRGAFGRVLAGNVASHLLTSSPCAVVVAPRGLARQGVPTLSRIGVAFDGGSESWIALQAACAIAVRAGATLRLIRALEPLISLPETPVETEELLAAQRAQARLEVERATASISEQLEPDARLIVGDPVHVLEREAHDGLDLLVLGSRGYGPVRRVLLSSVSGELVRLAACPLIVVPRDVEFDAGAGGLAARDEAVSGRGGT